MRGKDDMAKIDPAIPVVTRVSEDLSEVVVLVSKTFGITDDHRLQTVSRKNKEFGYMGPFARPKMPHHCGVLGKMRHLGFALNLDPQSGICYRSSWEQSATEHIGPSDLDEIIEHHRDMTVTRGTDDYLYRMFTRKATLLSLPENLDLWTFKIFESDEVTLTGERAALGGTPGTSLTLQGKLYAYASVKQVSTRNGQPHDRRQSELVPAVTISIVLEPLPSQVRAINETTVAALNHGLHPGRANAIGSKTSMKSADEKLEILMKRCSEKLSITDPSSPTFEEFMVALVTEFLNEISCATEGEFVPKIHLKETVTSEPFLTFVLSHGKNPPQMTQNPPVIYSTDPSTFPLTLPMTTFILNLLFPSFFSATMVSVKALPPQVVNDKFKDVKTLVEDDGFTGYKTIQTTVNLLSPRYATFEVCPPGQRHYESPGVRWAVTWSMLSDQMIQGQQVMFRSYNSLIEKTHFESRQMARTLQFLARMAITDFEDFYEINVTSSLGSLYFRTWNDASRGLHRIDHDYAILRDKLSLLNAEVAEDQRRAQFWANVIALLSIGVLIAGLLFSHL